MLTSTHGVPSVRSAGLMGTDHGGRHLRLPAARSRADLRPDWEAYFLAQAALAASRSACSRRCVGAVLVSATGPRGVPRVLSTGYNGTLPGEAECMDGGCPRGLSGVEPGSSYDTGAGACVALHAEQNALILCDAPVAGATLYLVCLKPVAATPQDWHLVLHEQQGPCDGCARLLAGHGVKEVVTP